MQLKSNITGMTIIEIMVSLSVVSFVVIAAYGVASRSRNVSLASQERSQANGVAESQLERLREVTKSGSAIFDGQTYCIDETLNYASHIMTPPNSDLLADDLTSSGQYGTKNCFFDTRYATSLNYNAAGKYFTVLVRWEKIGGGRDEVKLVYGIAP